MACSCKASTKLARLSSRPLPRNAFTRAFATNPRRLAAQKFTMPAMSPTMTEGNIANWKIKEGESFSTGDVLLEIETDKAHMDVEAQDDGKMARIMQQSGAKGVKVGAQIAILADVDDNLDTITVPIDESHPMSSPQDDLESGVDPTHSSESQAEAPPFWKNQDSPAPKAPGDASPRRSLGKAQKQTYPLYPSIAQLLHQQGLPISEADKIPASGPKGRLLKGDVLAYLGKISSSYPSDQSARITRLGHLDLTHAKPAASKKTPLAPAKDEPQPIPPNTELVDAEIAVPVSLSSVLSTQKRLQDTLGVTLPLSTFIARATKLANNDLPRSATSKPTADELYNDILGLDNVSAQTSRGGYVPQITALPARPFTQRMKPQRQPDVYDMLVDRAPPMSRDGSETSPPGIMAGSKAGEATNVFSVSASKGEEKRARVFLERVKTILQVEPGKLIL